MKSIDFLLKNLFTKLRLSLGNGSGMDRECLGNESVNGSSRALGMSTSGEAYIEHIMSIYSAYIGTSRKAGSKKYGTMRNSCVWKYAACLFLGLILCVGNAWGTAPTLSDMSFSTSNSVRIVNEDFNSLSTTSATATVAVSKTDHTAYGVFNCFYNNNMSNTYAIVNNANGFSDNSLSLSAGSGSPLIAHITGKSWGEKGAYRIKTTKTSKNYIGFYNEISGNAYTGTKSSVYIKNTEGKLEINDGTGTWNSIGTYTSATVIDICVIYNNSSTSAMYGDDIALDSHVAHVYVNETAIMNDAGTAPKDYSIAGLTLSSFRVLPQATNGYKCYIDDVQIWNELPEGSTCATPVITPATGTMLTPENRTVTITCETGSSSIYYTTDGTNPTTSSTLYSGPFKLDAGVTTVKAIATKTDLNDSEIASVSYTWGKVYTLATSSTVFAAEDEVIITNSTSSQALSTTQNANNRGQTDVTASDNKISLTSSGDIQIIKLENSGNYWLLNVGTNQYLYAAGTKSNGNTLKTSDISTIGDRGKWRITINASSEAKIAAQATNADSIIRYNSTNSIFSCYAGTQNAIKIYRYHRTAPYIRMTPSETAEFVYAVGYGPSAAQALTIEGFNLDGDVTVACPSGYEISSTSPIRGFSTSSLVIEKDENDKINSTVYVRLSAGKSVGDGYDGTLTIADNGVILENISLTGSVEAIPANSTLYRLITHEDDIFPDDEIVIMNAESTHLLSNIQASSNRKAASSNNGDNFVIYGSGSVLFTKDDADPDSVQNIILDNKCKSRRK